MTTPQQQPETFEPTERTGFSAENVDAPRSAGSGTDVAYGSEQAGSPQTDVPYAGGQTGSPRTDAPYGNEQAGSPQTDVPYAGEQTGSSAGVPVEPERPEITASATDSSTLATESSARHTDTSAAESLFADHELSDFRSRWTDVQASFVDEPRECVQKADALVADVVERLTAGFAEARSQLEGHWAQGEQASTESLRVALKRYRDFFERLLAI